MKNSKNDKRKRTEDFAFAPRTTETEAAIPSSSEGVRFRTRSGGDIRTVDVMDQTFSGGGRGGYDRRYEDEGIWTRTEAAFSQNTPNTQIAGECNHLAIGTMIAERYEIQNVLGIGGFSIVYKAYDHKLETEVAVKELYPPSLAFRNYGENKVIINGSQKDYDYLLDRFVLEARTLAKYNSDPHIVHIYDCVLENSTAYIVMEYLDGQNLKEYTCSQPGGRVPLEKAIDIIGGVLDGLERIHKKGILHRDIKPKNIILTQNGEVKIIDFGAARFYASEKEVVNNYTKVFTPGFAPPEQYQTEKKQGAYTDIYAAAATFYFMLTGEVPEVSVDRRLSDTLKPLSEALPGIPKYVDNAVRRALELNAELRVQSASNFKLALLGKKKIRTAQAEKKTRIRRRVWLAAATLMLFAAGAAGFYFYQTNYAGGQSITSGIRTDDTLEVWLPVSDSDEKQTGQKEKYDSAVADYMAYIEGETHCQIKVNVTYFAESDYSDAISKAYKANQMPDVFDSTSVSLDDEAMQDCGKIFRYLSGENYALYSYYQDKQIPKTRFALGFNAYVLYFNDKLKNEVEAEQMDSFDQLLSVSHEASGVYGVCCKENIFGLDENKNLYTGKDASSVFREGKALCYIGTVSESIGISEALPGYWSVGAIPEKEKIPIILKTWSVCRHSDNKEAAALSFLYYFTGEDKQDYFYLQNRDILPVHQTVLSEYSKFYPEFAFVTDDSSRYAIGSSNKGE